MYYNVIDIIFFVISISLVEYLSLFFSLFYFLDNSTQVKIIPRARGIIELNNELPKHT